MGLIPKARTVTHISVVSVELSTKTLDDVAPAYRSENVMQMIRNTKNAESVDRKDCYICFRQLSAANSVDLLGAVNVMPQEHVGHVAMDYTQPTFARGGARIRSGETCTLHIKQLVERESIEQPATYRTLTLPRCI